MTDIEYVPATDQILTVEEMNDPNIEIIYVQHSPDITSEQAQEAYKKFSEKSAAPNITITELLSQTPVYPVSFGSGQLHVSRKVDQFLIATPSKTF